jgi:methionyl-tRNA synthetase
MTTLLQAGRLSQTCTPCGITEAAGYSCTACGRPTGPNDWFEAKASEAQRTAARTRRHERGRKPARDAETANPVILA